MRSVDRSFYESSEWRKCAKAYLVTVNNLCERCLSKGLYEPAKIVHHKIHLNENNINDAEITFNFSNLEALCLECHNQEHYKYRTKKRYKFSADGTMEILNDDEKG